MPSFSAPAPERGGHGVEVGLQAGRTRHHQQERRFGRYRLAGVQQHPPHLALQRMGLIEEQYERTPRATCRQQQGQGLALATQLPAESSDAGRERRGVRPQRREP